MEDNSTGRGARRHAVKRQLLSVGGVDEFSRSGGMAARKASNARGNANCNLCLHLKIDVDTRRARCSYQRFRYRRRVVTYRVRVKPRGYLCVDDWVVRRYSRCKTYQFNPQARGKQVEDPDLTRWAAGDFDA